MRTTRAADRLEPVSASKIHHPAFDANLIGIDPDYRIHVANRLPDLHDGPFPEPGLKSIAGAVIQLPRRHPITLIAIGWSYGSSSSKGRRSKAAAVSR